MRHLAAITLLSLTGLAVAVPPPPASPPPAAGTDLTAPPASVMTGTVEERNATIHKAIESATATFPQVSFNDIPLDSLLRFMGQSQKIDIRCDSDALQKAGIDNLNINLALYDVTMPQVIELALWQLRPTTGRIGWKIDNGTLNIVPIPDPGHAKESDLQKKQAAAIQEKLKSPAPLIALGKTSGLALTGLTLNNKLNLVVDWKELEAAGLSQTKLVTTDEKNPTIETVLKAALAAMDLKKGQPAYEIWGGAIRVSTRDRLDREKPLPEKNTSGLP